MTYSMMFVYIVEWPNEANKYLSFSHTYFFAVKNSLKIYAVSNFHIKKTFLLQLAHCVLNLWNLFLLSK